MQFARLTLKSPLRNKINELCIVTSVSNDISYDKTTVDCPLKPKLLGYQIMKIRNDLLVLL